MFKNNVIMKVAFTLVVSILSSTSPAEQVDSYASFNDIVAKLNPLEVIENIDGIRRSIDLNIRFELGQFELMPEGKRQLADLGKAMNSERLNDYNFYLVGHTDASGSKASNLLLSNNRAKRAVRYLREVEHVSPSRLGFEGKGSSQLLRGFSGNDARHRRVEVIAVKKVEAFKASQQFTETHTSAKPAIRRNKLGIVLEDATTSEQKHAKDKKIIW
jgi:outer membrane protein OmpA-like peptidoglycan-associated protein